MQQRNHLPELNDDDDMTIVEHLLLGGVSLGCGLILIYQEGDIALLGLPPIVLTIALSLTESLQMIYDDYASRYLSTPTNLPIWMNRIGQLISHNATHAESEPRYKNETLLEQLGVDDDWIPGEFRCPILGTVIDGTPVYAPPTTARFDQKGMDIWLAKNKTHPIMPSRSLDHNQLQFDSALEHKINTFIEFMHVHAARLKILSPEKAKKEIDTFLDNINSSSLVPAKKQAIYLNGPFNYAISFRQGFFHSRHKTNSSWPLSKAYALQNNIDYVGEFITRYGSCYEILDISPSAKKPDIEKAYKKLAREYHPDKNPSPDANAMFQKIQEAKNILVNVEQRELHDLELKKRHSCHFSASAGIPVVLWS